MKEILEKSSTRKEEEKYIE